MSMETVPSHLLPQPEPEGGRVSSATIPTPGSDLSHLHEEIIEQDGYVEEYLAYDIREMYVTNSLISSSSLSVTWAKLGY